MAEAQFDVVVVGGGPAGLTAALWLGRCQRRVFVVDAHAPRNGMVTASHGTFTRDGASPAELRRIGRAQAEAVGARFVEGEIVRAWRLSAAGGRHVGFGVQLADGRVVESRALMLATGLRDVLPDVPGMDELYGRGVFPCPYCEGYEYRGKRLGSFGSDEHRVRAAINLRTWSEHVTLYANLVQPTTEHMRRLREAGVRVMGGKVTGLWRTRSEPASLYAVEIEGRAQDACDALFVPTQFVQASDLPRQLGCVVSSDGTLATTRDGAQTSVQYVYAAGDAAGASPWIACAAGDGAKAATMAHAGLLELDYP